ncbi:Chitin synthase, class 3 [Tulasnella sp. 403]|nr:Chitin synthase, class 3 [Tulasnella sp. 403]
MDRPPRATPPRFPPSNLNPSQQRPPVPPKRDPAAVTFSDPDYYDHSPQALYSPQTPSTTQQLNAYDSLSYQPPPEPADVDNPPGDFEANVRRKKSLVRPDRERIDPSHRQWYYRNHAAQMEYEGTGRVGVMPSSTGNVPQPQALRRGKSLLAREEDSQDSPMSLFKRGTTLRRKRDAPSPVESEHPKQSRGCFKSIPGPHDPWVFYCYAITACFPPMLLSLVGIKSPEQQRAWREKIGLVAIIVVLMAGVGFLTFGFTQAVCNSPPARIQVGHIATNFLVVHGYAYDLGKWFHPPVSGVFDNHTNPLFEGNPPAGGMDASFLFQNVNQHCSTLITLAPGSSITIDGKGNLGWYFPCNAYSPNGTTGPNLSGYDSSKNCHIRPEGRKALNALPRNAQIFYTWDDVANPSRNLAVYESTILDLNLLNWLDTSQVHYPPLFDQLRKPNGTFNGKDLSAYFLRSKQTHLAECLQDIATVGFVDTKTIGCVASEVVLYVSLVFIIGVVAIKFVMAVIFGWFLSWRIGAFGNETYQQRMQRAREIENWTDNIHSTAPARYRPTVKPDGKGQIFPYAADKRKTQFFPTTSRFSKVDNLSGKASPVSRPMTAYGSPGRYNGSHSPVGYGSKTFLTPDAAVYRNSRSSTSLPDGRFSSSDPTLNQLACPWPLAKDVVPQPPPDYEPNNYPLAHTICLVTAYSESIEGLRTTLDSLATTSYPNSHKLIMVIADGMVKGSGNDATTPEIVLGMMKDFVIEPNQVQAHSYVAIADGHKRHNMAKVYAGFYEYDNATVETSKQQRVPMVLVAKVGNPLETNDAKPGNRGKRDSQIVLMSFLQKVMFDERMTTFEYEFFNSIWRVTGVSPDRYELVLCVDADTKVFPDSLSRMVACMVHDEEIMGLCGETKIANKGETWVTMIQVFEYYISHHLTKAFESMFGGVTCLPGCFSMYRIKAPKGSAGFWVPVLANPDIVEHYSENIVDTLHKKNLLLLGEDRYLTTLMLKTFPKRKMVFCPQAVCKTIVPDTFGVLLSQRRRWINSTVHNLAELLLVRDLCGTFCFSMQFVVFMELAGTLVLPAAISFTLYLIIFSAIPTNPTPVIPLILLGIILGLPGLLIVVTSRKFEYVGWMFVYLLSLPIWNFVLPAYAFWHFDDFSWGQTRMVAGEKGGGHLGDKEGEFDSSHIVMKRWAEFERDRRAQMNMGPVVYNHSRDSTFYDVQRTESPRRDSKRFSVVSAADSEAQYMGRPQPPYANTPTGPYDPEGSPASTYHTPSRRGDLMLPAPLAVGQRKLDEDHPYNNVVESGSNHRLIPSPGGTPSDETSTDHTTVQERHYQQGGDEEEEDPSTPVAGSATPRAKGRGVSLVDPGPVPSGGEARRVPRPSARRTSMKPAASQAPPAGPSGGEERARPVRVPPPGPPPGAASPFPPQGPRWNDPRYQ